MAQDARGIALLERHGAFLVRLAQALVGDSSTAEDLAQETLSLAALRGESPNRPWLAAVLRRKAANRRRSEARRAARERAAARPEAQPSAADRIEHLDLVERLFGMVRELDEPQREAILARFYRGASFAQIESDTGVAASTVQSRVQSGLALLRERLDRGESGGREAWLGALGGFAVPSRSTAGLAATGNSSGAWIMTLIASSALALAGAAIWIRLQPSGPLLEHTSAPADSQALVGPSVMESSAVAIAQVSGATAAPTRRSAEESRQALLDGQGAPFGYVMKIDDQGQRVPAAGVEVHWTVSNGTNVTNAAGAPTSGFFDKGASGTFDEGTGGTAGRVAGPLTTRERPGGAAGGMVETNTRGGFELGESVRTALEGLEIPSDKTFRIVRWEPPTEQAVDAAPITLVRIPHGVMEGRVMDLDARPMKGVTVRARAFFGGEQDVAITDDAGHFALHPTTTDPRIRAELAGHVVAGSTEPVARDEGGWEPQNIVMTRTGVLEIDLGPGPERGLAVLTSFDQFHTAAGFNPGDWHKAPTNKAGIARIEGLPVGQSLAAR